MGWALASKVVDGRRMDGWTDGRNGRSGWRMDGAVEMEILVSKMLIHFKGNDAVGKLESIR